MLSKAQIKYIQALQLKKNRQKFGQFVAEGDKIVQELLLANQQVAGVYATREWLEDHRDLAEKAAGANVTEVDAAVLKQLSSLSTPNGALAVVAIPAAEKPVLYGQVSLVLETVQDPGNLGTIIRIADWFGITQVICSPDCVDAYNAKTVQSTMGSITRVKVYTTDLVSLLADTTVPSYAATLHGDNIAGYGKITEGMILIGNESRGLSDEVMELCSHRITIPRLGGAESLNAAVATGIICGRLLI
ncbi:RNA methyltransferase [Chitinophaga horti]|uniref:RNA methyltransferase n=1 Tax=Chitinophaga horti TaxID=2920382 RepID=A0ABY6J2F0_9BACT|nr:RNA methyltransferase [Chitinophaga horti]UYQ93748.1 RNA methyltransferase [Chitinophaga horti]